MPDDLYTQDWKKSPAHLLFLSKFLKSESLARYSDTHHWETALKEKPLKVIEHFLNERVLEPAPVQELLEFKFKASDLKEMLKVKGLKVSGRKEDLIQRLVEHDRQAACEATRELNLYRCTAEGMQLAQRYLKEEDAKRVRVEQDVLHLLTEGDLSRGAQMVAQFEASQVFPRGFGINWSNHDVAPEVEILKAIFEKTPGILKGIVENQFYQLRLAASMMALWGVSHPRKWFPDDCETGIHLASDTACRMLLFHALHLRNIKIYRQTEVKRVEVVSANNEYVCSACRQLSGKLYTLKDVPELPHVKCTSEIGCRCRIVARDL